MARIALASFTVRFPVGGYLSWTLQWLLGLHRLGHDVYFVEKAGWKNACWNPGTNTLGDDCSDGVAVLDTFLRRFGLQDRWCFVDWHGNYYGLGKDEVEEVLRTSDLFLDTVGDGAWRDETAATPLTVYLDGEAGYCQMRLENATAEGVPLHEYDRYYTVGLNIGTSRSSAPTASRDWQSFFDPVLIDLYAPNGPGRGPYTTVMSWQTHAVLEYKGKRYRQKDAEFVKFMELPTRVSTPLEVAVAGERVPYGRLERAGWRVRDAHAATITFDAWRDYIAQSRGEFSVVKNVFVETWSGWFSDRSACYLASGRPVVLQDTGWSEHLPTGEGLFAIRTLDEAAAAIEEIEADYKRHSKAARRIAEECLSTDVVLPRLLSELGVT